MIGIEDFITIVDTAEEVLSFGLSPEEQVSRLSQQKAGNVALLCSTDDLIIAADTLVYIENEPLGKPESESDAIKMLTKLSGRKHSVYTGVTLIKGSTRVTAAEKTDVYFRKITDSEISAYVQTGEPMDKAGAYAAQGRAAVFIERIDGDFYNVVGLPLCRLVTLLKDFEKTL